MRRNCEKSDYAAVDDKIVRVIAHAYRAIPRVPPGIENWLASLTAEEEKFALERRKS